ncbi:hypothetical protein [Nocardia sp. NPDC050413]|uniref:hypothetical protein n=1 Tax=Nocardia sp. NPDC050413 TaxID=3155784 RepID=UPI0033F3F02C
MPTFWAAATLGVPISAAAAMFIFGVAAKLADTAYPAVDVPAGSLFGLLTVTAASVICLLAWKRSPRSLGAALGLSVILLFSALFWALSL